MRILAFITDPPLVDKILRHLGWHPGEPAPDLIRAPPATPPVMLKVAESPPLSRRRMVGDRDREHEAKPNASQSPPKT